jgi:hypothetical protein
MELDVPPLLSALDRTAELAAKEAGPVAMTHPTERTTHATHDHILRDATHDHIL